MKKSKVFLSAVLAAAAVCSAAYAAAAIEDGASSVESGESSESSESSEASNSDSSSGLTSNYLEIHMRRANGEAVHFSGEINYREGDTLCSCPTIGATARISIPVGCSGTFTINQSDYPIISIKIGNSTTKRDMTKESDNVYGFTIQEGDTDMYVIYEGDDAESSAPAPTTPTRPSRDDYDEPTTHESTPEPDTNPDTGIALAIPAVTLSAAAVIVATNKRK